MGEYLAKRQSLRILGQTTTNHERGTPSTNYKMRTCLQRTTKYSWMRCSLWKAMGTLLLILGTMRLTLTVRYSYPLPQFPSAQHRTLRNGPSGSTKYITGSSSRKYVRHYVNCVPSNMYSRFLGKFASVRSNSLRFKHITEIYCSSQSTSPSWMGSSRYQLCKHSRRQCRSC